MQLFGSGSILPSVLKAQQLLADEFDVAADVWSATSYQQLRDEALSADRWNRLHPEEQKRRPYVVEVLDEVDGPIVAASDYVKTVPDFIRPWVKQKYVVLGTDGYGRSDTREALRRFFEVDAESIAVAALYALCEEGKINAQEVTRAIQRLGIDPEKPDPVHTGTSPRTSLACGEALGMTS